MKKVEPIKNIDILLPQSLGDNIQWYGFRVSYIDQAAMSADGADCQFFAPDKYRVVLATGRVGYDVLPSVAMGRPTLVGGQSAKSDAAYYLIRELHLTDEDIFDLAERLQGYEVSVVIAPHPMVVREGI